MKAQTRLPKAKRHSLADETLVGSLKLLPIPNALFALDVDGSFRRFAAHLLTSLGHPTRLQIVMLLRQGPMTVSQLCQDLEINQANCSQHLGVLSRAGAVTKQHDGTARLYSLTDELLGDLVELLETLWKSQREGQASERSLEA